MSGFFLHDDVCRFLEARREAHEALGWPANAHVTLNDIRGMAPQPHEIVDAFHEVLMSAEFRSRRLAFVASQTVVRSQVLRALANREARCFTDSATAEAWLFESDTDTAHLRRAVG